MQVGPKKKTIFDEDNSILHRSFKYTSCRSHKKNNNILVFGVVTIFVVEKKGDGAVICTCKALILHKK